MAGAVLLRVIEGGAAEPRVAFASAPELPGVLSLDRIPPSRGGWSTVRIAVAAIVSVGFHAGLIAWGQQHQPDDEARAAGGSDDTVITEGISVVLVDSLPSDASAGSEGLREANQVVAQASAALVEQVDVARPVESETPPVDDSATPAVVASAIVPRTADSAVAAPPDDVRPVESSSSEAVVAKDVAAIEASAVAAVVAASETVAASADTAPVVAEDTTSAAVHSDAPLALLGEATIAPDVSEIAAPVQGEQVITHVRDQTAVAMAKPIDDVKPVSTEETKVAAAIDDAKPIVASEEPEPVALKPPPAPKPKPAKPRPTAAPRSEQRVASVAEAAARGPVPGTAGAGGASNEERGSANASGYQAKLAAHLRRYRSFPEEARLRRISGVATVRFTVNAAGAVTRASLARSSGEGILDAAAVAMVHRASPFPPIPANLGVNSLTVNVPVRFDLR